MMRLSAKFALGSLILVTSTAIAADSPEIPPKGFEGFDAFVESTMAHWKVPGLSTAVVRDGKVVLAKGYGLADIEKRIPVTSRTIFAIGSITKSFTATLLGQFVDEGKLAWDRRVVDVIPEFKLKDRVARDQVTILDLLSHRTGLPRHDGVWYRSALSRQDLVEALRHVDSSREFRAEWQYNNLMFVVAGRAAERIEGKTWETLVGERLLAPLGMSSTNFSVKASRHSDVAARPYALSKGAPVLVDFREIDAIGPAGAINSNIEDMSKYLIAHMSRGEYQGRRIFSEATSDRLQSPRMVISDDANGPLDAPTFDELGHVSYGLGFFVSTYRGRKLVGHSGSIDGFSALMAFIPREKVGVVLLANLSGNRQVPVCVLRNALDRALGLEPIDWVKRAKELDVKAAAAAGIAQIQKAARRRANTKPSHELSEYAGDYSHPAYGKVSIAYDADRLVFHMRGGSAPMLHRHYDVFDTSVTPDAASTSAVPILQVRFDSDAAGAVNRLMIPFEPRVAEIVFNKTRSEPTASVASAEAYDVLLLGGKVVDGTGNSWFLGDVAVKGDRVVRIAPAGLLKSATAKTRIDATGLVVSPGFIDIQSHSRDQLLSGDGRVIGKVTQGVTTEILGEGTSNAPSKEFDGARGFDAWLKAMEAHGSSVNFGSFLGSASVRSYVKGLKQGAPSVAELSSMRSIVRNAMEDGAFGLASALIYPPDSFVGTDDLIALAKEMSRYGGVYITHMRSEGDKLLEGIDETVRISREGGVPAEIYHLKAAGKRNWSKIPAAIERIQAARKAGLDVSADMYPYVAGGTGLTACLPPWSSADGKLLENLGSAAVREKIRKEVMNQTEEWENMGMLCGSENILILGLKKPENLKHVGKRLDEIAKSTGKDWLDTAMDLIRSEGQRVDTIYFMMSEENVKKQLALPWIKFGTDAGGHDPDKPNGLVHPRSYGTYPRILGKYVRDEAVLSLEEAVRKMTSAVADRLSIRDRGLLREGLRADIVVFDPQTIMDRATFENPHQTSVGVRHVFVNGVEVISKGSHTGAKPGRIVRGPGYRPH